MAETNRGPVVAVGVVLFNELGKVLLIKRGKPPAQGLWTVPGGRVDWGESLEHAARRELLEETNMVAAELEFAGVFERISAQFHYLIVDFMGMVKGDAEPQAGDDAAAARWIPVDELEDLELTDQLLPVILQCKDRLALPG